VSGPAGCVSIFGEARKVAPPHRRGRHRRARPLGGATVSGHDERAQRRSARSSPSWTAPPGRRASSSWRRRTGRTPWTRRSCCRLRVTPGRAVPTPPAGPPPWARGGGRLCCAARRGAPHSVGQSGQIGVCHVRCRCGVDRATDQAVGQQVAVPLLQGRDERVTSVEHAGLRGVGYGALLLNAHDLYLLPHGRNGQPAPADGAVRPPAADPGFAGVRTSVTRPSAGTSGRGSAAGVVTQV
jgi:hypothetical protein